MSFAARARAAPRFAAGTRLKIVAPPVRVRAVAVSGQIRPDWDQHRSAAARYAANSTAALAPAAMLVLTETMPA
jgi:hypothetical protein